VGSGDSRLLTVPEEIARTEEFWVTGNEFVALPQIRARDGAVLSINVLSWGARGLLELTGPPGPDAVNGCASGSTGPGDPEDDASPLLRVGLETEAGPERLVPTGVRWLGDWIPEVHYRVPWGTLRVTWLAPWGHKGLVVNARVDPPPAPVTLYVEGCVGQVRHRVFTARGLASPVVTRWHRWMECLVWEVGSPWPFLAVAVRPAHSDIRWEQPCPAGPNVRLGREGEELTVVLGIAPDGDGAACQAVDLLRQGYPALRERSLNELSRLAAGAAGRAGSPANGLEGYPVWRRNLLFNFFYSRGMCLDSEELVLVTSRSPRYYVCAAHWSRDSLLWSFPGLLLADTRTAREALLQAFRLYSRRAGTHSLYLDGTELYPGFELDELAAFPVALGLYLEKTGDRSVLESAPVREGLARVWEKLEEARIQPHHLYRTFLLPSDDPAHHPVVTYDNVLAWKALTVFARLGWPGAGDKAGALRCELRRRAVVPGPFGPMWAWSFALPAHSGETGAGGECTDGGSAAGEGYVLYDEPPGSLALLAHYGWCDPLDPVYLNTLRWIWSPHNPWYVAEGPFAAPACPHARHPWVMSLVNALLVPARSWKALGVDPARFRRALCSAALDGGLACETIDAHTGKVRTGAAFATCAGFMAWALAQPELPG